MQAASLVRAVLPRHYATEGGQTVDVRPPSVREALEILYLLRYGSVDTDEDDRHLLRITLLSWLGPDGGMVARLSAAEIGGIVRHLVMDGLPERDPEDAEEEGEADERDHEDPEAWIDLLLDYCEVFNLDPFHTYTTMPFPWLAGMAGQLHRATARRTLREIDAATVPNMEKTDRKAFLRALKKQARGNRPVPKAKPMTEAQIKQNMDALQKAFSPLGG